MMGIRTKMSYIGGSGLLVLGSGKQKSMPRSANVSVQEYLGSEVQRDLLTIEGNRQANYFGMFDSYYQS